MRGSWNSSSIVTTFIVIIMSAFTRPLATSALVVSTAVSKSSSRSFVALAATTPTGTTSTSSTTPQFWNREESTPRRTFASQQPVVKHAKIVSLSLADDPANSPLHQGVLPEGSSLLAIGTNIAELDLERLKQEEPNVLFVSHAQVCMYCMYVCMYVFSQMELEWSGVMMVTLFLSFFICILFGYCWLLNNHSRMLCFCAVYSYILLLVLYFLYRLANHWPNY
jgi:hypothetical protein